MYEINIEQSQFEQATDRQRYGFQKGLYDSWKKLTQANETSSVGTQKEEEEVQEVQPPQYVEKRKEEEEEVRRKEEEEVKRGQLYQFHDNLRNQSELLTLDKIRNLLAQEYGCQTKEKQDRVIAFMLQDRGGFAWTPAFTLGGLVYSIGDTVFQLKSEQEPGGFKLTKGQNPGDVCFVYDKELIIEVLNETTNKYENLKVKLQYQLNVNDDGTFNALPLKVQFEETPLFNQQIKPKLEKYFGAKLQTEQSPAASELPKQKKEASKPNVLLPLAAYYLVSTLVFLVSPPVGLFLYSLPVIGWGIKKLSDWVSQSPEKTVDTGKKVSNPDRELDNPVEDKPGSSYERVLEQANKHAPSSPLSNSADAGFESFPSYPDEGAEAPKQDNNRRSTLTAAGALPHKGGPKDSDPRHSIRRTQ